MIIRFAIIFVGILAGFVLVWIKIFLIQTRERPRWEAVEKKQESKIVPIPATRGNIYDCNGQLLAGSMPEYLVFMDTGTEALKLGNDSSYHNNIDSLCAQLSRIIGDKSPAEYKRLIDAGFHAKGGKGNRHLKLCKHRINYLQRKQIEQIPLHRRRGKYSSGITFEDQHQRIKPFGSLASRTIGDIYKQKGTGNSGLEMRFNQELTGTNGKGSIQTIGNRSENITLEEAQDGYDIQTTIDINLQDIVESTLREPVETYEAAWGCCILMEVKTGEIKAISNLVRRKDGTYGETTNMACQRMEPGSTFKTISLLAGLDDGLIHMEDRQSVTVEPWEYLNNKHSTHTDSHRANTTYDVRQALAVSSNIALAKYITSAYNGSAERFVNKLQKMGIRDSFYCEIPGANNPLVEIPKDKLTIAKMSYGYSVEFTPMQVAMIYNAIANNGRMMRPMLVRSITRDGVPVQIWEPQVLKAHIAGREAIDNIRLGLHDVVWNNELGTASREGGRPMAQSDLVHIAGKTGTVQLRLPGGTYSRELHRFSFCGFFPEENPQYTCICVIENPKRRDDLDIPTINAPRGCSVVVRKIAEQTMAYAGCYQVENNRMVLNKRK